MFRSHLLVSDNKKGKKSEKLAVTRRRERSELQLLVLYGDRVYISFAKKRRERERKREKHKPKITYREVGPVTSDVTGTGQKYAKESLPTRSFLERTVKGLSFGPVKLMLCGQWPTAPTFLR